MPPARTVHEEPCEGPELKPSPYRAWAASPLTLQAEMLPCVGQAELNLASTGRVWQR